MIRKNGEPTQTLTRITLNRAQYGLPSHATGDRRLVEPLARAAAAVGADGIIVEVHNDPEAALCDGPHSLYAHDFPEFARRVAALLGRAGQSPTLLTAAEVATRFGVERAWVYAHARELGLDVGGKVWLAANGGATTFPALHAVG